MKLLLLGFIVILFPIHVMAQQLYVSPSNKHQSETNQGQKAAPDAVVTNYARKYYSNCVQAKHPILEGADLQLLCSCTAAKFTEVMSASEIEEMQQPTSEGQHQRNRMLMFVYAPCIEFPTRAMIMNECMSKTQNQYMMKNQVQTCECLADGVAKDMAELAPQYIEQAIRKNPKDLDPLALLLNSDAYEKRSIYHTRVCLSKYEGL